MLSNNSLERICYSFNFSTEIYIFAVYGMYFIRVVTAEQPSNCTAQTNEWSTADDIQMSEPFLAKIRFSKIVKFSFL